jgi:hypothetical protein
MRGSSLFLLMTTRQKREQDFILRCASFTNLRSTSWRPRSKSLLEVFPKESVWAIPGPFCKKTLCEHGLFDYTRTLRGASRCCRRSRIREPVHLCAVPIFSISDANTNAVVGVPGVYVRPDVVLPARLTVCYHWGPDGSPADPGHILARPTRQSPGDGVEHQ